MCQAVGQRASNRGCSLEAVPASPGGPLADTQTHTHPPPRTSCFAEIFHKVQKQKQRSSQSNTVSLASETLASTAPVQTEKRPCCVAL